MSLKQNTKWKIRWQSILKKTLMGMWLKWNITKKYPEKQDMKKSEIECIF